MAKQMKHRSKAEDVLITKIIKMLLLTLGLICSQFVQGTVLIRNAAELKSFSKGEEEHLEKVSSRMFCSCHRQMKLISKLIAFFVSHKSSCLLHDLPA